MATLIFCDFEDALEAIQKARSESAMSNIIDQVDVQFAASTLEVTPANWAHLASAFSVRMTELRAVTSPTDGQSSLWPPR
ncbi:hypothetical protein A1D17_03160 [Pseudomonas fluorescens]|uniref:Uncharacterized protein n=2 Tax=Pseudomonas TaxID=286 RepID=A0A166QTW5_PSEFL|nr:hypothetical protein A1D17_03160 [Pseudomonas fluorescens]